MFGNFLVTPAWAMEFLHLIIDSPEGSAIRREEREGGHADREVETHTSINIIKEVILNTLKIIIDFLHMLSLSIYNARN